MKTFLENGEIKVRNFDHDISKCRIERKPPRSILGFRLNNPENETINLFLDKDDWYDWMEIGTDEIAEYQILQWGVKRKHIYLKNLVEAGSSWLSGYVVYDSPLKTNLRKSKDYIDKVRITGVNEKASCGNTEYSKCIVTESESKHVNQVIINYFCQGAGQVKGVVYKIVNGVRTPVREICTMEIVRNK